MLTLGPGETISAVGATATAITYTISGMELNAGVEAYKVLAQGQLPSVAGVLYTAPASTQTFVKSIHLVNTTGSDVTGIKLFKNGTGTINQITGSLTIPANGWATYEEDGWRAYNSNGERLVNGTAPATGGIVNGGGIFNTTWTFSSTTTDADPGAGNFRFSIADDGQKYNATIYISNTDANGVDVSAMIDSWIFDQWSTPHAIAYSTLTATAKRAAFKVVGRTLAVGYRKINIEFFYRNDATPIWANLDVLTIRWYPPSRSIELPAIGNLATANDSTVVGVPGFIALRAKPLALVASRALITPIRLTHPIRWLNAKYIVSTAATAATGNTRVLLYPFNNRTVDGVNGSGPLIYDSGVQTNALAATGIKTVSPLIGLAPGYYWLILAIGTFTGAPVIQCLNGVFTEGSNLPAPSALAWQNCVGMNFNTDYTAAPPNPIATLPTMLPGTLNAGAISDQFDCPIAITWEPMF